MNRRSTYKQVSQVMNPLFFCETLQLYFVLRTIFAVSCIDLGNMVDDIQTSIPGSLYTTHYTYNHPHHPIQIYQISEPPPTCLYVDLRFMNPLFFCETLQLYFVLRTIFAVSCITDLSNQRTSSIRRSESTSQDPPPAA
jgi:hypothetical protein